MKRTELREHIFKMVFGYEFNSDAEMPQQMQLYFEQMDDGEPDPKDVEYIRNKALDVILKTEEIDKLINDNTKGWKTAPYPAPWILKYIASKGGSVIINSDCHNADFLDFAFDKALALAEDCGVNVLPLLPCLDLQRA